MRLPKHIKAESLIDFCEQLEELEEHNIEVTVFGGYFVCSYTWDRIFYEPVDVTIGTNYYERDPMVVRYRRKQMF